ncbi:N-acetylmuramoyl-L-alanine amidase [Deinococcus radiophilus]|uniref:N-acetylmuramoyl-L-alanine amidase n=1 Tax=Deinococcus radiophilus TaxID=32062 RepID=A0A431VXQ7_9DEIO|nr:N-acetylmuramoyl-L-alanine amidase [Deinococcus radiophilus]RTR28021.1 N-acetylmuramoyl-L-alanine amidase [Deinococcus radiophilus]UFA51528.1 N-acetylmuramoyl-L-alanine amidase [Deinococcus radiophilus]
MSRRRSALPLFRIRCFLTAATLIMLTPLLGPATLAQAGTVTLSGERLSLPQSPVFVAYPPDGHRVAHAYVLVEGSVLPGADLRIGGRAVPVGADGLFVEWVPLRPGLNPLRVTSHRGGQTWSATLRVIRAAAPVRPPAPLQTHAPRVAEVVDPGQGWGVNTVRSAWEDDAGRAVLYARQGQRVLVTGQRGDLSRVQLADGRPLWATRSTLRLLPAWTTDLTAQVGGPIWVSATAGDWHQLRLPTVGRVPFVLSEIPGGLRLSLVGAQSVGAWTPPSGLNLRPWQEGAALHFDLSLPRPLHGFAAGYQAAEQGDELVLRFREAPAPGPLAGRHIVLDAGHGGSEKGGAGPLRVPEKDIVLPIALRAAQLLRAEGATVTLTRQGDVTVPLYDRPQLAERVGADVLVSVHANAIPDGKDPRTVRGAGSYFSYTQSRPLADALQRSLVAAFPAVGDDGLHPQANLALTRPTSQPSVLLELGYLTDPQNLRTLMSAQGQEGYAQAIAAGLRAYFAGLPD